jgi:hypothetical protein
MPAAKIQAESPQGCYLTGHTAERKLDITNVENDLSQKQPLLLGTRKGAFVALLIYQEKEGH